MRGPGAAGGGGCLTGMVRMAELVVARLLQSPLGQEAEPGQRGDMVRISDGRAKIYLTPDEFDEASDDDLRVLLVEARREARAARDARKARGEASSAPRGTTAKPSGAGHSGLRHSGRAGSYRSLRASTT